MRTDRLCCRLANRRNEIPLLWADLGIIFSADFFFSRCIQIASVSRRLWGRLSCSWILDLLISNRLALHKQPVSLTPDLGPTWFCLPISSNPAQPSSTSAKHLQERQVLVDIERSSYQQTLLPLLDTTTQPSQPTVILLFHVSIELIHTLQIRCSTVYCQDE